MTRQTSIEAYRHLVDEGVLSERRREVYAAVYRWGPGTSAEMFEHLQGGGDARNYTQSRARFTELRDMGLFCEMGTRQCNRTGREAILWDVTDRIQPLERQPKPTKNEELSERLGKLLALLRNIAHYVEGKGNPMLSGRINQAVAEIMNDSP